MSLSNSDILALIRSFYADYGLPPTPSARALREYLSGPGQLQVGSFVSAQTGTVWLRPFRNPRWYVDMASSLS
jgi:hypothetical protein